MEAICTSALAPVFATFFVTVLLLLVLAGCFIGNIGYVLSQALDYLYTKVSLQSVQ